MTQSRRAELEEKIDGKLGTMPFRQLLGARAALRKAVDNRTGKDRERAAILLELLDRELERRRLAKLESPRRVAVNWDALSDD